MSGVARSIAESELPELDWKCALCGDEEAPLMLGPWREDDDRYLTVTRCRDWRACASRTQSAQQPAQASPEGDEPWM